MQNILSQFDLPEINLRTEAFGTGLINSTWKITDEQGTPKYILQKINQQVFNSPSDIAHNIRLIDTFLKEHAPGYLFVSPIGTTSGAELVETGNGYYRLFPFIQNSRTFDVVETHVQAYEAAREFAKFTKILSGFDASQLKITLPHFHDLSVRYQQFEDALRNGNTRRIKDVFELIETVKRNKDIVENYETYRKHFRLRVTHHDTKISNVLFDQNNRGLCVIDLDTVMPGYFISDVGDMMRTYLCPVSEEEKDFSKICIRKEFYEAVLEGYLTEMGEELNEIEKKHFHFAGEFMIYMQAIRFLTDHLNDDVYYGAKYAGHNFVRAGNQLVLLEQLQQFLKSI